MKVSNYLSSRRIGLLFKRDLVESYRPSLIVAAAVFGVFLVIYLLSVFALSRGGNVTVQFGLDAHRSDLHLGLFGNLLFLGGFIITGRAFREVHSRIRNHDWLMLPASTLEKFGERWFVTSIGYAVAALAGYSLFSVVAAGVAIVLLNSSYALFNPLSRTAVLLCLNYVVAQSLFLLGAVYFRKNHFVKTVLVLIGSAMVLAVFASIVFRIVYRDYFEGMVPNAVLTEIIEKIEQSARSRSLERTAANFEKAARWIYWALFAPIFLTIGFFRLRETEVKDGV
jgi:hypothetical protein